MQILLILSRWCFIIRWWRDVQNIAVKIRTREILFSLICNDRKLYFANNKTQYIKIDCYLETKSRYKIFKNCLIANTCKITIYIKSCFHKVINCRKDLNCNRIGFTFNNKNFIQSEKYLQKDHHIQNYPTPNGKFYWVHATNFSSLQKVPQCVAKKF